MCVAGKKVLMFFFPAKKLRNAPWEVVAPIHQYTLQNDHFLFVYRFVEVKNTDTHLYIRQTNNLFVYTDAKKDAKISLYFAYLGLLSAPRGTAPPPKYVE